MEQKLECLHWKKVQESHQSSSHMVLSRRERSSRWQSFTAFWRADTKPEQCSSCFIEFTLSFWRACSKIDSKAKQVASHQQFLLYYAWIVQVRHIPDSILSFQGKASNGVKARTAQEAVFWWIWRGVLICFPNLNHEIAENFKRCKQKTAAAKHAKPDHEGIACEAQGIFEPICQHLLGLFLCANGWYHWQVTKTRLSPMDYRVKPLQLRWSSPS